jgi:hypothetical protein
MNTTRSASATEKTVQRNGNTARQRVLIAAEQAKAANLAKLAEDEKAGRVRPITGGVTGYDPVTGDFIVGTPDGGEIRAQNLSTGAPTGSVPVQRFPGSQRASFNAPPSQGDQGAILAEIEAAQRDVFNALADEAFPFRLDGQPDGTYTIDPYQHYRVRIEALEGVTGATVTVSPTVGNVAEIGDAISITVSGSASGTPVLGSVLLRRVG